VRRFALASIGAELGVAISELRIEKVDRIPQLVLAGSVGHVELSLSHHGAYAGFACRNPRIDAAARISRRIAVRKAARSHDAPHASISYPSRAVQGDLR
jgi:hypothetical protein